MEMKVFLCFAAAALLLVFGDWFLDRHVLLGGRFYRRDAPVLVPENGLPEQADRLKEFQNLYWLDLRGTGITPEEYEKLQQAAGTAQILWSLPFQG